jgi:hypothetical protein
VIPREVQAFCGIGISDNCNANTGSNIFLSLSYRNGTGVDGKAVLTGSEYFTVKDIKVIEITD